MLLPFLLLLLDLLVKVNGGIDGSVGLIKLGSTTTPTKTIFSSFIHSPPIATFHRKWMLFFLKRFKVNFWILVYIQITLFIEFKPNPLISSKFTTKVYIRNTVNKEMIETINKKSYYLSLNIKKHLNRCFFNS